MSKDLPDLAGANLVDVLRGHSTSLADVLKAKLIPGPGLRRGPGGTLFMPDTPIGILKIQASPTVVTANKAWTYTADIVRPMDDDYDGADAWTDPQGRVWASDYETAPDFVYNLREDAGTNAPEVMPVPENSLVLAFNTCDDSWFFQYQNALKAGVLPVGTKCALLVGQADGTWIVLPKPSGNAFLKYDNTSDSLVWMTEKTGCT